MVRKNSLIRTLSVVALAAILVGTSVSSIEVSAGSSDIIVDDSSFAESLNSAVWSAPEGDITASNGKIVFTKENIADSRLVTKNALVKSSQHEELFRAEVTMKLDKIPKGKTFAMAFSLLNIESMLGEEESFAIRFKNDGGAVKADVVTYDADGKAASLVKAKSVGSSVKVKATATTDDQVTITVNGSTLYKGKAPIDLSGRMGFLQDAPCSVEISHVNIVSHKYDTPENANVTEDFEGETINVNAFDSYMKSACGYFPSGLTIQKYNKKNVLMFNNVGVGWFGTTYQYSNFECTFDVPYILLKNELRENGTIKKPAQGGFMFTYGDPSSYYDEAGHTSGADSIYFEKTVVRNYKDATKQASLETLGFYHRDTNEGYSVKVRMEDTQLTLWMKNLDDAKWQEVLSYKTGDETPMGYVHIWAMGTGNFAIDNFKITNLDKDPKVIDVEYKSNPLAGTEDWEYKPMEVTYLDTTQEDESAFSWPMLLVLAAGVGVVIVVMCIIIANVKKKPKTKVSKKEAENDEI